MLARSLQCQSASIFPAFGLSSFPLAIISSSSCDAVSSCCPGLSTKLHRPRRLDSRRIVFVSQHGRVGVPGDLSGSVHRVCHIGAYSLSGSHRMRCWARRGYAVACPGELSRGPYVLLLCSNAKAFGPQRTSAPVKFMEATQK